MTCGTTSKSFFQKFVNQKISLKSSGFKILLKIKKYNSSRKKKNETSMKDLYFLLIGHQKNFILIQELNMKRVLYSKTQQNRFQYTQNLKRGQPDLHTYLHHIVDWMFSLLHFVLQSLRMSNLIYILVLRYTDGKKQTKIGKHYIILVGILRMSIITEQYPTMKFVQHYNKHTFQHIRIYSKRQRVFR